MSPLQIASVPFPFTARVVALPEPTVKVPVCALSGTHSPLVRPNPAAVSSAPAAGAAVARDTDLTPVTGVARRTSAASRSSRGAISVISNVLPSPSVAVAFSAGLPAGTGVPGVAAKQLAAVAIQFWSTRTPVQARELASSPMFSLARAGTWPAVTSGPVTAEAGTEVARPADTAMAVTSRPLIRAGRGRVANMCLP
ncbi:hypothetical protein Sros01_20440 [Streptomyces roseochromogenus]|nr:hypothetical protein Sros01_20440 [Streptomyces roseochromogenus]